METNFIIPFLVAALGALLGAIATRFFSRRQERFQTTIDLFRYYHSPDMIVARKHAWFYLKSVYVRDPKKFSDLFSDKQDEEHKNHYGSLIRIIYFWYLVWMLQKEGEISSKLARRMLSYQYEHWRDALQSLYEVTSKDQGDKPEWLPVLDKNQMGWIVQDR